MLKAEVSVLLGSLVPTVLEQQLLITAQCLTPAFQIVLCCAGWSQTPRVVHLCSVTRLCSEDTMGKRAPLNTRWPLEKACLPCFIILQSAFYFLLCLEKQTDLLST